MAFRGYVKALGSAAGTYWRLAAEGESGRESAVTECGGSSRADTTRAEGFRRGRLTPCYFPLIGIRVTRSTACSDFGSVTVRTPFLNSGALVPPGEQVSEVNRAVAVGIDLIECGLTFLARHLFIAVLHKADEFVEREPPIMIDIVGIEIGAQVSVLPTIRHDGAWFH